jgi:hypothetical protein
VEPPVRAEKFTPAPVVEEEKSPPVEAAAPVAEPAAPEPEIASEPEPVAPPAPTAATPRQKPIPSDVEAELAAALGLTLDRPLSKAPEPRPFEAKPAEMHHPEPEPAPESESIGEEEPAPAEPARAASVDEPAPAESPKAQPEPEKPAEPAAKEIDPFSVDAIEAEFARLLGRDPKAKS